MFINRYVDMCIHAFLSMCLPEPLSVMFTCGIYTIDNTSDGHIDLNIYAIDD